MTAVRSRHASYITDLHAVAHKKTHGMLLCCPQVIALFLASAPHLEAARVPLTFSLESEVQEFNQLLVQMSAGSAWQPALARLDSAAAAPLRDGFFALCRQPMAPERLEQILADQLAASGRDSRQLPAEVYACRQWLTDLNWDTDAVEKVRLCRHMRLACVSVHVSAPFNK